MREAPVHTPADPPAEEQPDQQQPVPSEPAPLPPNDPAMTAEERQQLEDRHAQAVKDWKQAVKEGRTTDKQGPEPSEKKPKEFTGTTTEDLEPANKRAAAETATDDEADAEDAKNKTSTKKGGSKK